MIQGYLSYAVEIAIFCELLNSFVMQIISCFALSINADDVLTVANYSTSSLASKIFVKIF